jgi:hypothetical protein
VEAVTSTPLRGVNKEERSEVQQTNIVRSQVSELTSIMTIAATLLCALYRVIEQHLEASGRVLHLQNG